MSCFLFQFKRDGGPAEADSVSDVKESKMSDSASVSEAVNEVITFTGDCEFCHNPIKPFPTLHQQVFSPHTISQSLTLSCDPGRICDDCMLMVRTQAIALFSETKLKLCSFTKESKDE